MLFLVSALNENVFHVTNNFFRTFQHVCHCDNCQLNDTPRPVLCPRACGGVRAYVHACMCADVCVSVCPKLTCSNMKRLSILCSNVSFILPIANSGRVCIYVQCVTIEQSLRAMCLINECHVIVLIRETLIG